MSLTPERLRERLFYDQGSGVFTYLVNFWSMKKGAAAGYTDKDGYIRIGIDRTEHPAHRLAFLYVTGEWPVADVDHINGKRADNRWQNLRQVTRSENLQNQRKGHADSRSGLLGANWHSGAGRWSAAIAVDGKRRHLGLFDTAEEAHAAYVIAKREYHPGGML